MLALPNACAKLTRLLKTKARAKIGDGEMSRDAYPSAKPAPLDRYQCRRPTEYTRSRTGD